MLIVITVTKLIFKLLIFFPLHLGRLEIHIALLKFQPVDVTILPQSKHSNPQLISKKMNELNDFLIEILY